MPNTARNIFQTKRERARVLLPESPEPFQQSPSPTLRVRITEKLRALRGKNKAHLVRGEDGRYFVQKFHSVDDTTFLFNEALGCQLAHGLGLSVPAWAELIEEETPRTDGGTARQQKSSFGSAVVAGDIFEILPGGWYCNVENLQEAYRWLLFDLWCNHADSRQAVFQVRSERNFRLYFVDHDQMFSPDDRAPLTKKIARARYLDARIYRGYSDAVMHDLRQFANRIRGFDKSAIHGLANTLPDTWGSRSHRERTLSALTDRSVRLNSYLEAIAGFGQGISAA